MADLNKYLASVYEITKKNIAVLTERNSYRNPQSESFDITFDEAASAAGTVYKGYSIHRLDIPEGNYLLCMQSDIFEQGDTTELIKLGVISSLKESAPDIEEVKRILSGSDGEIDFDGLSDKYSNMLDGYIVVIDGCGELYDEAVEVLVNTAEVPLHFSMGSRLFAVLKTDSIEEVCNEIYKNIVTELFIECSIAAGGKCSELAGLRQLYDNCLEALLIRKHFKLKEYVLMFEKMYSFRVAAGISDKLKESIIQNVFTKEFRDLMSSELTTTIEEFFKNNLNLTDTAAKLYVHRNTLLYRLDKIHKATGYDLKKFEDSWLFRLAWLIYKERQR